MPRPCCEADYDRAFDARTAERQLDAYRHEGARGTTRRLIEAVGADGVAGARVLDVGGGVGIIGLELLRAGAASVTLVDASRPYVEVARTEAERRGFGDRTDYRHGDFVEMADGIEPADIVTLDRVLCCYGDWATMIDRSAERARRLLGLVYPNDRWWMRIGIGIGNFFIRLSGTTFRGYVHPERAIHARIRDAGFERRYHHRGWLFQTIVYERVAG